MSTPTRAVKRLRMAKLQRLAEAAERAQEDLLVGIHEEESGDVLSQAAIAAAIGGVSPSVIKGRALKGEAILAERKGL